MIAHPSVEVDYDKVKDQIEQEHDAEHVAVAQKAESKFVRQQLAFVPLRLTPEERRLLRLLEAALHVSEYTDKVDILSYRTRRQERIQEQMEDMMRIISGMYCAADFRKGKDLIASRSFKDNCELYTRICEVGRRNKIMNPEKMRATYGKLMWMVQDSGNPMVSEAMGFDFVTDIVTVETFLEERDASDLLNDPNLDLATQQLTRASAADAPTKKREAQAQLEDKYVSEKLPAADLKRVVASVDDFRSFLLANQHPVDRMIAFLKTFFDISKEEPHSLAIMPGKDGSCLRHSHRQQFVFVLQSLTLWREIIGEMFRLWYSADSDLLHDEGYYRLVDTGQGLNRMQSCPRVARAMSEILARTKAKVGSWVGLSVVHLGDRDVPNALVFIDKYTQVSRILSPIVNTLDKIDEMAQEEHLRAILDDHFGGAYNAKHEILADFFKHGFDGSGDDGGSCIDGRLTSAWNWCSRLEKKKFYNLFMLAGFVGFDGEVR